MFIYFLSRKIYPKWHYECINWLTLPHGSYYENIGNFQNDYPQEKGEIDCSTFM